MHIRRVSGLIAVALLAAACSSGGGATGDTADGSGGELQSTRWVLDSYVSTGVLTIVPDDQYADAEFTAQRVTGFAGCNDYDAVYRTGGRMLLVSPPRMTLMACSETANAFETSYVTLLEHSRFYNVRANMLTIRGADGTVLLVFDAPQVNPLLGSWVVDSYATSAGSVTVPLPGTELTAVFRLAKVSGSSGCNTYDGAYTTNGVTAAIGPLASTRLACPDDVLAQEASFLAALQGVARIETRAQTLQLQDRNGSVVVALSKPSTPEPSASPSAAPSASASTKASPSTSSSAKPSPPPKATPTPTKTPTASPPPVASGSPAPTIAPPASLPPVATCAVVVPTDVTIATIVYPAAWHTIATPPTLACRYFDPEPIAVPADPATLTSAVMIKTDLTVTYTDALAAATNPTAWNVLTNEPVTLSGLATTRLEGTSTTGSPSVAAGETRYGYLIDIGGHPAWIETVGTVGDPTYDSDKSVVDLLASQSTITVPAAP